MVVSGPLPNGQQTMPYPPSDADKEKKEEMKHETKEKHRRHTLEKDRSYREEKKKVTMIEDALRKKQQT